MLKGGDDLDYSITLSPFLIKPFDTTLNNRLLINGIFSLIRAILGKSFFGVKRNFSSCAVSY